MGTEMKCDYPGKTSVRRRFAFAAFRLHLVCKEVPGDNKKMCMMPSEQNGFFVAQFHSAAIMNVIALKCKTPIESSLPFIFHSFHFSVHWPGSRAIFDDGVFYHFS